jgi:acyl carrier protein phosphodiesterase
MNFLAHLFLAAPDEALMVGNFIADHVKGRDYDQYGPHVARGIRLHRAIDTFSDLHPLVRQSAARLRPRYRHYAGVIVDVFYDHFLASHWATYSPTPLPQFAEQAYNMMQKNWQVLPPNSRRFLAYAQQYDILVAYAQIPAIGRVMAGMSHRAKFGSEMAHATDELQAFYADFGQEFGDFFPQLQQFVAQGTWEAA